MNISTASDSKFNPAHYSEALTTFSAGYKDPHNLPDILEFIAPTVNVSRRFEFVKSNNAEAFLSDTDDSRAPGNAFKRVQYSGESVNEKTHNKGLTIRIDHDEALGSDWQERYVQLLIQRLYRNEIRRALQILDAAAIPTSFSWNKSANPDADLRKILVDASNNSGIRPNRILFGESAWDARITAFENKDNPAAFRLADITTNALAQKLLVDEVHILRSRIQSSKDQKSLMLSNALFAFYAQAYPTKDEPSNLKRFVTPTTNGSPFRVYLEESAKYTDITVEHYSNILLTSNLGIQKIQIANP